jgi:hypothetical protein
MNNNLHLLDELRTNEAVESALMFGQDLHVTFKNDRPALSNSGLSVDFQPIAPSIEDCFIYLMNKS